MQKLGEILVSKGLITGSQLDAALKLQLENYGLIGRIMVTESYIKSQNLQRVLAEKYQLPYIDLSNVTPDETIIDSNLQGQYLALNLVPIYQTKSQVTIAVTDINQKIKDWCAANYKGFQVDYVITSPFDILWYLQKLFAENDDEAARLSLLKKLPKFSARSIFGQKFSPVALAIIALFAVAYYYFPQQVFLYFGLVLNICCLLTISFKVAMFSIGRKHEYKKLTPANNLPVYTVLVPVFKEEKIIPNLIKSLQNIDYPKSALDIKLVVENDDEITINAIKMAKPPEYMEIIRVPYSQPQTKPKACNYALNYARGEYITIYDAEDCPDPAQLKIAISAFENGPENLACVQARLNYYNANKNLFTKWFALEYGTWFEVVMKGLRAIKAPLPLGGTSNHIKTDILKNIGGWDAFNVTEDADLGMRLAQQGYVCDVINSVTMEEAVDDIWAWLKQRTRWLKGFFQTYLVHMRSPIKLIKNAGFQAFATLQFFVGLPFVIYVLAPIWAVMAYNAQMPEYLSNLALINLFYGAFSHIFMAQIVADNMTDFNGRNIFSKKPYLAILLTPIYGMLLIFAAYRALYQLFFKPYYWDKTDHG